MKTTVYIPDEMVQDYKIWLIKNNKTMAEHIREKIEQAIKGGVKMLNEGALKAKLVEWLKESIEINDGAQSQKEVSWRAREDFVDRFQADYWIDDWKKADFSEEEAEFIGENEKWFAECVEEAFEGRDEMNAQEIMEEIAYIARDIECPAEDVELAVQTDGADGWELIVEGDHDANEPEVEAYMGKVLSAAREAGIKIR